MRLSQHIILAVLTLLVSKVRHVQPGIWRMSILSALCASVSRSGTNRPLSLLAKYQTSELGELCKTNPTLGHFSMEVDGTLSY